LAGERGDDPKTMNWRQTIDPGLQLVNRRWRDDRTLASHVFGWRAL